MSSTRPATVRALAVYTVLRVALFALVWGVIWFLTPLDAVWSAAAAILISGAISLVLLDRQRGRVGAAAGGFFSRLNARIDSAKPRPVKTVVSWRKTMKRHVVVLLCVLWLLPSFAVAENTENVMRRSMLPLQKRRLRRWEK